MEWAVIFDCSNRLSALALMNRKNYHKILQTLSDVDCIKLLHLVNIHLGSCFHVCYVSQINASTNLKKNLVINLFLLAVI